MERHTFIVQDKKFSTTMARSANSFTPTTSPLREDASMDAPIKLDSSQWCSEAGQISENTDILAHPPRF